MHARCFYAFICAQRLAMIFLAVALLAHPLGAQTYMETVDTVPGSGVKIQVFNVYGEVPIRGYLPLRVTITNSMGEEGVWTISTDTELHLRTEAQGRVAAHSEDTFEVLAPLHDSANSYGRAVNVSINGPGVNNSDISWRSTRDMYMPPPPVGGYGPTNPRPVISSSTVVVGLSRTLATSHTTALKDYFRNVYFQPNIISDLDPDLMPADWRGYLGFDLMVFTASDWLDQSATVRAAILQWVAAGGDLRFVADQDGGLSLPPRLGEHYGAGVILLFPVADLAAYNYTVAYRKPEERHLFNFNYLPVTWLAAQLPDSTSGGNSTAADKPPSNSFAAAVPVIKNQFKLVALLILAFGILVGPVNLFVFCRGVNRARLLWVTPLLSLGATALLLLFIILSEGIGGHGVYYRVTQLDPDGKFAVESQVNASITGMLFRREFHFTEPAWVTVDEARLYNNSPNSTYSQAGARYWGDWFGSRQTQLFTAEAVAPTRAAVRLVAGPSGATSTGSAAPSLRSEYNGELDDLYYIDRAGNPWKTARLANGEVVQMQPSSIPEIAAAWHVNIVNAPMQLQLQLHKLTPEPGTFFALGDDSEAPLQPNLSGLNWTSFHHLVLGPVVQ